MADNCPLGGAVEPGWASRARHAGTYDENWRKYEAPLLPADFFADFFQAAPERQVMDLKGGEPIRITGLYEAGDYRFRLPQVNRVAEIMAYRASCLNLVVNAIILWNTVYLSRAVDYIRSQGIIISDELLSQVAPLPWAHIAPIGDYLWNEIDRPLERLRPIRAKPLQSKQLQIPLSVYYCRNAHGAPIWTVELGPWRSHHVQISSASQLRMLHAQREVRPADLQENG